MRIVARSTLAAFWEKHPETKASLLHWHSVVRKNVWRSMSEVQASFPKAGVLNDERVRFEVSGGNNRLITSFTFRLAVVYIKFIGAHAEYENIDPFTVTEF